MPFVLKRGLVGFERKNRIAADLKGVGGDAAGTLVYRATHITVRRGGEGEGVLLDEAHRKLAVARLTVAAPSPMCAMRAPRYVAMRHLCPW